MTTRATEKRHWLFGLIAWSIPILFFVLAEGLLRLVGFGDDYPLFVELPQQPAYLQPNPDVIKRFFSDPAQAPPVSIDTGYFLAQKPDNGLRIVVQGGSSAAGFPYGKHASPAGMLQQRLTRSFPGRTVEVILTAMSAVNSYTLFDFADEIVDLEPDAVLIYAGHNEYLGVLGVGSSFGSGHTPALTRLFMNLRASRLFQLMQSLIGLFRPDAEARTGSLMANVAGERSIPLDSALFKRGVRQFQYNLDALLARYAEAGIPVFIGTLVSNERDQAPFMGKPAAGSSDTWTAAEDAARTALAQMDYTTAAAVVEKLLQIDATAADAWFFKGRVESGLSRSEQARAAFRSARDLDRLRFRAPSVFEQVIRETAARHNAHVVEIHDLLAASSPDGLVGNELMLEHLHPNLDGYMLLADGFFNSLQNTGLGLDWRAALPEAVAHLEQPLTRIEKLHGEYRVHSLMHDWPFVDQKQNYEPPSATNPEQQIAQAWYRGQLDWIGAMNQGLVHYQRSGDYAEAARIAVNIADGFPFEAQPQHVAGQMLVRQTPPQGQRAIRYFHRAATLEPKNVQYLVTLARAYVINGYPDRARNTAERLLSISPENEIGRQIIEHLDSQTP